VKKWNIELFVIGDSGGLVSTVIWMNGVVKLHHVSCVLPAGVANLLIERVQASAASK
jgi:hypothetical protein